MREMAQEEYDHLVQQVEVLQKQLRMALIPPDPYEERHPRRDSGRYGR